MKWNYPPLPKYYEALGAVADERLHVEGNIGKVYSSSGNKHYDVTYNPESNSIMVNDNASYWKGYLGYPAIAFLMKIGVLSYDEKIANILKTVSWKDINQKFKNDFDKALEYILSSRTKKERKSLEIFVTVLDKEVRALNLDLLGEKVRPPEGY
jgi:hypothetical protein